MNHMGTQKIRLVTFEVTYMTERKIKYQCPICNLPYMHKGGVERHIKLNHSLPEEPKKIISTSRMGTLKIF